MSVSSSTTTAEAHTTAETHACPGCDPAARQRHVRYIRSFSRYLPRCTSPAHAAALRTEALLAILTDLEALA
jgi:hypothetical protein